MPRVRLPRGVGVNTGAIPPGVGVRLPGEVMQGRVTVPAPPSTNALFNAVPEDTIPGEKPRVRWLKDREYAAWSKKAVPLLMCLKPPERLPCVLMVLITGKVNERRDGDNFLKAVTDAVVAAKVLPGDSLKCVAGGHWLYAPGPGPARVEVWFEFPGEVV